MITFRVHGYWLGPLVTEWSTHSEEEFEEYCKRWGFVKDEDGVYRNLKDFLEIKTEENGKDTREDSL